jgi:hypothetical protein
VLEVVINSREKVDSSKERLVVRHSCVCCGRNDWGFRGDEYGNLVRSFLK